MLIGTPLRSNPMSVTPGVLVEQENIVFQEIEEKIPQEGEQEWDAAEGPSGKGANVQVRLRHEELRSPHELIHVPTFWRDRGDDLSGTTSIPDDYNVLICQNCALLPSRSVHDGPLEIFCATDVVRIRVNKEASAGNQDIALLCKLFPGTDIAESDEPSFRGLLPDRTIPARIELDMFIDFKVFRDPVNILQYIRLLWKYGRGIGVWSKGQGVEKSRNVDATSRI